MTKLTDTYDADDKYHNIEKIIGETVRRIRKNKGLSANELARKAGISVSMISRIENGQTSSSLTSLKSLADSLDIPLLHLFHNLPQNDETIFVKAGQGLKVQKHNSCIGHQYQLLGHSFHSDIGMEPYLITLAEETDELKEMGNNGFSSISHDGIEFMYILDGEMIFQEGGRTYHMCAGDSIYFNSKAPHGPVKFITLPLKLLTVISSKR